MTGFHYGPMLGFDVESSGVDVETDRIVTAALVWVHGPNMDNQSWLLNPGISIPEEATKVHGITNEQAAGGDDPADILPIIAAAIMDQLDQGLPVVVMNAPYDLSMLDRELRRHTTEAWLDPTDLAPIIDPYVLDKAMDPYRKGGRKLTDLCKHYQVPFDGDAHTASADAFATLRLAWRMAEVWNLGDRDLTELHQQQIGWRREQQESLAAYFRKTGKSDAGVNPSWPIIPKLASV